MYHQVQWRSLRGVPKRCAIEPGWGANEYSGGGIFWLKHTVYNNPSSLHDDSVSNNDIKNILGSNYKITILLNTYWSCLEKGPAVHCQSPQCPWHWIHRYVMNFVIYVTGVIIYHLIPLGLIYCETSKYLSHFPVHDEGQSPVRKFALRIWLSGHFVRPANIL
jgi:hypothetical protein